MFNIRKSEDVQVCFARFQQWPCSHYLTPQSLLSLFGSSASRDFIDLLL